MQALDRARLFEAERTARAEAAVLYRLSDAVASAQGVEPVYEAALDAITSALGVSRASILLFDTDGVMRFKAWRGLSDTYRAAVEGHSPWTPDEKNPTAILVEDYRTDVGLAQYAATFDAANIRSLGFFPLVSEGRLIGKFMVYHSEPHSFSESERRIAAMIARKIAHAVERQLVHDERERFVGIVGHDLRNPLSAITMGAASLIRRELDEGSAKIVRRIVSSADRMSRMIQQLLGFAQARHGGGIPIHRSRADLAEITQHVIEELEAAYPERTILFTHRGELEGEWDSDRMAEVISNLVGNAIQHGDGGPVSVNLVGKDGAVTLDVHNKGAPIRPDLLAHLFDPFRRGGSPRESIRASVGLGLYISKELVRAHGGSIAVSSAPETGTVFTVRLPRQANEHEAVALGGVT